MVSFVESAILLLERTQGGGLLYFENRNWGTKNKFTDAY